MFNSEKAALAGQKSRRGKALPIDVKTRLNDFADTILNELINEKLDVNQKIKLLHLIYDKTLPRMVVSQNVTNEMEREFTIEIIK